MERHDANDENEEIIHPPLNSPIRRIKYIGRYLQQRLNTQGIYTCYQLWQRLHQFGHPNEHYTIIRQRVKEWLHTTLINERSLECCPNNIQHINNQARYYRARFSNFKGYNSILLFWRHYVEHPYSLWIPHKLRGFEAGRKFPRECAVE